MAEVVIEATNVGRIQKSNGTYAAVHDAADASFTLDAAVATVVGQEYGVAPTYAVVRSGLEFSLASVPQGITIRNATLSLYGSNDTADTDFDITLVSGADLASVIVAADYGDLLNAVTSYGALTTLGFVYEGWNVLTLNADGIAAFQAALASNVVRFGVRSSRDISVITPKLNGAAAKEFIGFYGLTANKKPKLTITYVVGKNPHYGFGRYKVGVP